MSRMCPERRRITLVQGVLRRHRWAGETLRRHGNVRGLDDLRRSRPGCSARSSPVPAEKAGMPKARDAWGREVLVPNDQSDEFVRALSECDENWTDKRLAPPSRR
jgi:hypothetical protein